MKENNLQIWEDLFQQKEWGKYPAIALIKFTARNFYKKPDRSEVKILELGLGTGANMWYLAREGFTVSGVEGSKTAVKQCMDRLEKEGLSDRIEKIHVGDYFEELNRFDDAYFDAIVDVESFCCNPFDKTKAIIDIALKKLKPGGLMFSQTFADGTWGLEGEETDYHALIPSEGPMKGLGLNRYTTREDIDLLYKRDNTEINWIERTDLHLFNDKCIKEWAIELKKK